MSTEPATADFLPAPGAISCLPAPARPSLPQDWGTYYRRLSTSSAVLAVSHPGVRTKHEIHYAAGFNRFAVVSEGVYTVEAWVTLAGTKRYMRACQRKGIVDYFWGTATGPAKTVFQTRGRTELDFSRTVCAPSAVHLRITHHLEAAVEAGRVDRPSYGWGPCLADSCNCDGFDTERWADPVGPCVDCGHVPYWHGNPGTLDGCLTWASATTTAHHNHTVFQPGCGDILVRANDLFYEHTYTLA